MKKNISLRRIQLEDEEPIWSYVSDPQVSKYLTWETYTDRDEFKKFFTHMLSCNNKPNEFLAIIHNEEVIGTAHIIERATQEVQFSFGIHSSKWQKGIGNNVFPLLLKHIINIWNTPRERIYVDVHKNNVAARKILRTNGFIHTEEIPDNRNRFRAAKIKISSTAQQFVDICSRDNRVELVYLAGSTLEKPATQFSDVDFVIVLKEEGSVEQFVKELESIGQRCGDYVTCNKTTPQHVFLYFADGQTLDINITTSAFTWMTKVKTPLFDNRGFLEPTFSTTQQSFEQKMLTKGWFTLGRAWHKYDMNEFWVVPRFLQSVREQSILPLLAHTDRTTVENIIRVKENNVPEEIYEEMKNTFVMPNKESCLRGLQSSYKLLEKLEKKCKEEGAPVEFSGKELLQHKIEVHHGI